MKTLLLSAATIDDIYTHEETFWGYYVKGAPVSIIFNIATSRGIVNGCAGVMESLTLADGRTLEETIAAGGAIKSDGVIELGSPPLCYNVAPDLPADEAAVLLASGLSLQPDRVVIPVVKHSRPRQRVLRSVHAALYGMPIDLRVLDHQLDLAFAITDFKTQSKTMTKLILSLRPRSFMPYFTLSTIYVLASRVKEGLQLRTIGYNPRRDKDGVTHLTSLQHSSALRIWEACYDDDGRWNADKCLAAIEAELGGSPLTPLHELAGDDPMEL